MKRYHKPSVPFKGSTLNRDTLNYIIQVGIQAPSGDNVQPWSFAIGNNSISLYINREADNSFFNVAQVASLIASGAALQNMLYAADALGLESDVCFFPEGEHTDEVARVEFNATGIAQNEDLELAMWKRNTNRRMFSTRLIDEKVWDGLKEQLGKEEGISLFHNPKLKWKKPLGQAVFLADRVRVERRDLHEYLMSIIYFKPLPKKINETDEIPSDLRTGMPLRNLQAGLMGENYMRTVRSWNAMRVANCIGAGLGMPAFGFFSVLNSGGVGMVCVNSLSETNIVRAGQAVERIWCELERQGIAFQPLAAIPLFTLRLQIEGQATFSKAHVRRLSKALDIARQQLNIPDNAIPVFMFRIGKSDPITQRTYRQYVDELIRPL